MTAEEFGQRLKLARTVQHLSQREVARRAGVSVAAICRWERGNRRPLAKRMAAIARAVRHPQYFFR